MTIDKNGNLRPDIGGGAIHPEMRRSGQAIERHRNPFYVTPEQLTLRDEQRRNSELRQALGINNQMNHEIILDLLRVQIPESPANRWTRLERERVAR